MLTQVDYELLLERIKKLEERVIELEHFHKNNNSYLNNFNTARNYTQAQTASRCLWDSIPLVDRNKPISLSCPCSKCSPHC